MRLRGAVLKRSLGRLALHDLESAWYAALNERAVSAIERGLASPDCADPEAAGLLDRLKRRRLVEERPFGSIPRREASDLVSLELEPIGRCNLACGHCFVRFSRAEMPEEIFAAVLEGATALGAVEVTFNGGEPLLHPRCVDWMEQARAAELRVLLFTNAIRVDDSIARRLAAMKVARVTVSLDGFEAEHDALRGRGSFDGAVAGIRRLVEAGVDVSVTTLLHPANLAMHEQFQRFCREELGVRGLRTSTVAPLGRAVDRPDLQLDAETFRKVYSGCGDGTGPGPREGRLPCSAGIDKLFVAAMGRVFACHLYELTGLAVGELGRHSLAEVHARARRAPQLTAFSPAELPECSTCAAVTECGGGCRPRAWAVTGRPDGADPIACRMRGFGSDRPAG